MALRAVFFDLGGTLMHLDPLVEEPWKAWARAARDVGLELKEEEIRRANEEADRRFDAEIYRYHGRTEEFWRRRDSWTIAELGVTRRREEFYDALHAIFADPARLEPYPESLEVLRATRPIARHLGVISNFTDGIHAILSYHRFDRYFDSVTYSQAVGAPKPDPRIFEHAIRVAGCEAGEAVHVGDSWESDYLGARQAGLRGVWLNRSGRAAPGPCEEVRDLRGLLPLVATAGPSPASGRRGVGTPDGTGARLPGKA
jgi:putative hydrolase of the HAD superfamily